MRTRVESPHVQECPRVPQLVWPNSASWRVWETSGVKIASAPSSSLARSLCPTRRYSSRRTRGGNLDFLIRPNRRERERGRGEKGTSRKRARGWYFPPDDFPHPSPSLSLSFAGETQRENSAATTCDA